MRHALVLLCCFVTITPTPAQTVKMLSSTEQSWSGGIAGHHGQNFTFSIEFSGCKNEPHPDTIWLGECPVPIIYNVSEQQSNTTVDQKGKTWRFDISAGTFHDDYADRYAPYDGKPKTKPHPPIPYSGVALLSYSYGKKQLYYTIGKISKHLTPVSYP